MSEGYRKIVHLIFLVPFTLSTRLPTNLSFTLAGWLGWLNEWLLFNSKMVQQHFSMGGHNSLEWMTNITKVLLRWQNKKWENEMPIIDESLWMRANERELIKCSPFKWAIAINKWSWNNENNNKNQHSRIAFIRWNQCAFVERVCSPPQSLQWTTF